MSDAVPTAPFGRMLTAMATAFHDDTSVDFEGTQRIAAHLVDSGQDGVVVSGTTGESPTTTVKEDGEILRAVVEAVGDRATVIAGVGTNDTAHSVNLITQAERAGADGALLVSPYYNKPSQAGLLHHFRTVTAASALPVMLYDVPGRTAITIPMEVYERALEWETVIAVKDAVGNMPRAAKLARMGYAVYCGDDANTLGFLAHGGCGLVSVAGHVAGKQLGSMISDYLGGDRAAALTTYLELLPVFEAVMGVPNYGATTAKAALQLQGVLDNRNVRGPLVPLDEDEYAALRTALTAGGLL